MGGTSSRRCAQCRCAALLTGERAPAPSRRSCQHAEMHASGVTCCLLHLPLTLSCARACLLGVCRHSSMSARRGHQQSARRGHQLRQGLHCGGSEAASALTPGWRSLHEEHRLPYVRGPATTCGDRRRVRGPAGRRAAGRSRPQVVRVAAWRRHPLRRMADAAYAAARNMRDPGAVRVSARRVRAPGMFAPLCARARCSAARATGCTSVCAASAGLGLCASCRVWGASLPYFSSRRRRRVYSLCLYIFYAFSYILYTQAQDCTCM